MRTEIAKKRAQTHCACHPTDREGEVEGLRLLDGNNNMIRLALFLRQAGKRGLRGAVVVAILLFLEIMPAHGALINMLLMPAGEE